MTKKKPPSPADSELWDHVRATITPLRHNATRPSLPKNTAPSKVDVRTSTAIKMPAVGYRNIDQRQPIEAFDPKLSRKLARGRHAIDSVIDLHGATQDQAYRRLDQHLRHAVRRGDRLILVITGKGGPRMSQTQAPIPVAQRRRDDFALSSGVLRRMVPLWLQEPALAAIVHSVREAHARDGGSGALYVRLRKLASM